MGRKNKKKEVEVDKFSLIIETYNEVIDKVRSGEMTHFVVPIEEENQDLILEFVDGKPLLDVEDSSNNNYGCYFYNGGEFPYVIRRSLNFLVLLGDEGGCISRIIDVDIEPGTRFNYQGPGKPIEEDPNGNSCIWEVSLEIVPLPQDAKTYLMRWNPSISSFTEKDYEECVADMIHGMFRMSWSINEWEEARRGDLFYMMRVGDDKAGIVFDGQFLSDPYPEDDWAGSTKRRMYVDMVCLEYGEIGTEPYVPLKKLQKSIPNYEWAEGHSGVLLSNEVADKLVDLCRKEYEKKMQG